MSLKQVLQLAQIVEAKEKSKSLPEVVALNFIKCLTKCWVVKHKTHDIARKVDEALTQDGNNSQFWLRDDSFLCLENIPKERVLEHYQIIDIDQIGEKFLGDIEQAIGSGYEYVEIQINLSQDEQTVRVYFKVRKSVLDRLIK